MILCCFAVGSHTIAVGVASTDLAEDNKNTEVSELEVDIYWEWMCWMCFDLN